MRDTLRLYHTILPTLVKFLPTAHLMHRRNLALVVVGPLLAIVVHLSTLAAKLPLASCRGAPSNRVRRFLDDR